MIRLLGSVTAQSPIHVSYPGYESLLPRTPHNELMLFGSSFRGPLRKAAYATIRSQLTRHHNTTEDQIFSLRDAYLLGEGVDITNEVNTESGATAQPVAEHKLRELNPMINLFGRWKVAGRLSTGGFRTPESNLMNRVDAGARVDMFERDPDEVENLSPEDRDQLIRTLESEREVQEKIDSLREEVRELKRKAREQDDATRKKTFQEVEKLQNQEKELKDSREGSKESIKHPLEGYEAVAPGSILSHSMSLITDDHRLLGLLIAAMSDFAREPIIGGHRAAGMGQITGEWTVYEWPAGQLQSRELGRIGFNETRLDVDGDELNSAYTSFIDALPSYNFRLHTLADAKKEIGQTG